MRRQRGRNQERRKRRFLVVVLFVCVLCFLCVWREREFLSGVGTAEVCAVGVRATGVCTAGVCTGAAHIAGGYADAYTAGTEAVKGRTSSSLWLENVADMRAETVLEEENVNLEAPDNYFTVHEIDDEVFQRINGRSYRENAHISVDELRYLKLLHYNYDHKIQVGELIVNEKIAQDCINIFKELFLQEYEIESMCLIDDFWTGDGGETDTVSIEHNNTSAFNYRTMTGGNSLSNHALGYAVDVNPLQNPYVSYRSDGNLTQYYKDMELYLDRDSGDAHMITRDDLCYQTFIKYGFIWGGDWKAPIDYQHFEKKME